MPGDSDSDSGRQAASTTNYKQRAVDKLDELVREWEEEGYRKAELTPPDLAAEAGINYNTWQKNGVTRKLRSEIDCLQYQKWSGFKIVISEYIEERLE